MTRKKLPAVIAENLAPVEETYVGLTLTKEDHHAIRELADLVADAERADQFPQWPQRAAALGLTISQVEMYRRTPEYAQALIQSTLLVAREGTATATANVAKRAKDGDMQAYRTLARMGGALETAAGVQINNTQINVSLEQRLQGLVQARKAEVIDAEPQ